MKMLFYDPENNPGLIFLFLVFSAVKAIAAVHTDCSTAYFAFPFRIFETYKMIQARFFDQPEIFEQKQVVF